ncbi:hypothetical protein Taro_051647 [Colocasia esculenta]|uniref:PSP proline-rich domain-containing protein n=1 Tax=Colocasia esculenta TaxID=4460 RepID=A0A843XHD1_COLES|nr:hypothetical protein [Colocasia esculenta]
MANQYVGQLLRGYVEISKRFTELELVGASSDSGSCSMWGRSLRYGLPPSYPHLKIPGLNAPIPPGASFGYHPRLVIAKEEFLPFWRSEEELKGAIVLVYANKQLIGKRVLLVDIEMQHVADGILVSTEIEKVVMGSKIGTEYCEGLVASRFAFSLQFCCIGRGWPMVVAV